MYVAGANKLGGTTVYLNFRTVLYAKQINISLQDELMVTFAGTLLRNKHKSAYTYYYKTVIMLHYCDQNIACVSRSLRSFVEPKNR